MDKNIQLIVQVPKTASSSTVISKGAAATSSSVLNSQTSLQTTERPDLSPSLPKHQESSSARSSLNVVTSNTGNNITNSQFYMFYFPIAVRVKIVR